MENRKKRILLVDDDPQLTGAFKSALEQAGDFHVWTENKASRSVLAARMFRPDVILLDVRMPDLDGTEVAEQMREDQELDGIPIVYFTSLIDPRENDWPTSERFLSKTTQLSELVERLERVIDLPTAA